MVQYDTERHAAPEVRRSTGSGRKQGLRGGGRRRGLSSAGLVTGAIALLALIPACSSSPSTPSSASTSTSAPTTSTTTDVTPPQGSSAEVASCEADAKTLEVALEADAAQNGGTYPSPPSPWSAGSYAANFGPLMTATGGGPYLHSPPATRFYVIEYDSSGHVWVAPPGAYGATYNAGQDFDAHPDACLAAVH